MPKKYTIEEVKKIFENRGCCLVSTEYINTTHTLYYVCICGNQAITNLKAFRKGSNCIECAKEKRKKTMLEKFGVECNLKLDSVKKKNSERKIYISNKCQESGCEKYRQGCTNFCIRHGGGKRCEFTGCSSSVRGADEFCVKHGGGKGCIEPNCHNPAMHGFSKCRKHGGGHRCLKCNTIRKSGNIYCAKHIPMEDKIQRNIKRKEKYYTNPQYRLLVLVRSRIYTALKGKMKTQKTKDLLGCTVDEFRKHIESLFQDGMTWENQGKWHIDHIIPCNSFDLSKAEEQAKCFHYTNTQPLWARDNLEKSCKI